MSKEYSDLLKDPRWQKLKALAMIRDNFTCQKCGATYKTLHVHHKKYTGRPWEAPLEDLVTLCCDCHNEKHVKTDDEWLEALMKEQDDFNEGARRLQEAIDKGYIKLSILR